MDASTSVGSVRGRKKLFFEGYMYHFDRMDSAGEKKFWRCEKRGECKARLHTDAVSDEVVGHVGEHTHDAEAEGAEIANFRSGLKRKAVSSVEQPSQIITAQMQGVSDAVLGRLPNPRAMRKVIGRVRKPAEVVPPAPATLAQLRIPEEYTTYSPSEGLVERFLLFDVQDDDGRRILAFGRETAMQQAAYMKHIFMDGTFRQAPPLFSQVYVILAEREQFVFPILYALSLLFRTLRERYPQLRPESISCDYEVAAFRCAQEAFEGAELHGCLFHLSKNLKKKLADENLLRRYKTEPDFAVEVRMLLSLAFVPVADLDNAFREVSIQLHQYPRLLDWFEDYYLGRRNATGERREPMFPPAMWNVYERTLRNQHRTNNYAEAAHRRLQVVLDVDHPSLWKFIQGLREVQKARDHEYAMMIRGDRPPQKKRKYIVNDNRINDRVRSDGSEVKYDLLIVAAGLELRYDMVGGLSEALKDAPNVCSIYRADLAEKTYYTLQQFSKGDALITLPNAPIKCSGAAQKICYLADEIFRKRGVRENIRMTYNTYLNDVFDVPKYAKALNVIVKQKGIQLNVRRNLKSIDVVKGEALFEIVDVNAKPTGETEIQKFDFLHASPPCSAPKVIRECADLANAAGWLDVDAKTLQSKRFPNVFGIGDCNGSPNKKTAAAIYSQMRAIATNVPAFLKGKPLTGEYNCYSSCPLIVGNNRVVLAEFTPKGPLETLPFDQGRPLYTAYLLKRYVLPFLYWQFGVKGTWLGPATVRKILHLGMTK